MHVQAKYLTKRKQQGIIVELLEVSESLFVVLREDINFRILKNNCSKSRHQNRDPIQLVYSDTRSRVSSMIFSKTT